MTVGPSDTAGLTPREITDRAAVQAAWLKFWDVYGGIDRVTPSKQAALINSVALDPTKSQILKQISTYRHDNLVNYGSLTHRIFWGPSIAGANEANIGDCMDQDKAGVMDVKTGSKKTHGYARQDTRGVLVKGADGIWRLRDLLYYNESKC